MRAYPNVMSKDFCVANAVNLHERDVWHEAIPTELFG